MKCEICGYKNPDNAKFCVNCGSEKLAKTIFCTNCGNENLEKTKFCPYCGSPLKNKSDIQKQDLTENEETIKDTQEVDKQETLETTTQEDNQEKTEATEEKTYQEEAETSEEEAAQEDIPEETETSQEETVQEDTSEDEAVQEDAPDETETSEGETVQEDTSEEAAQEDIPDETETSEDEDVPDETETSEENSMKTCQQCGHENKSETKFCGNCGSKMENQSQKTSDETQNDKEIVNIVNTNQIITKQMTDAFNAQNKSVMNISDKEKSKRKLDYFKYISKNPEVHDKSYDPSLVEVRDDGDIKDKNHVNVILFDILKYWGAAFIVFLILMGVGSIASTVTQRGLVSGVITVATFILLGLILLFVILNIGCFMDLVSSSRDSTFKLISSIHILPIIILITYSLLTVGLFGTILLIVAFLIIGGIGLLCLMGK